MTFIGPTIIEDLPKEEVIKERRNISNVGGGFTEDDWQWSCSHKSPEVVLSQDRTAAYFYTNNMLESTGTAGKSVSQSINQSINQI